VEGARHTWRGQWLALELEQDLFFVVAQWTNHRLEERQWVSVGPPYVCVCNIYTYIRVYIQIHSRAHVINESIICNRMFKFTAWRVFSYCTIAKPDDLYYIVDVNISM
jgi:hypothetical protein